MHKSSKLTLLPVTNQTHSTITIQVYCNICKYIDYPIRKYVGVNVSRRAIIDKDTIKKAVLNDF